MLNKNISLKKAALINAVSRYVTIIFQIIFSMVLARLLTPDDYGVVAITVVFTTLFNIFGDMGIATGVIQNKTLTDAEINGIYKCTLFLGIVLGVAFSIFSFPMAMFYSRPILLPLGWLLAINLFFSTINMVPNALLLKDKQFVFIAKINVIVPFITGILTILMALIGMKYYALVLQSVLASMITFGINYYYAHHWYELSFMNSKTYSGIRKIFNFSFYQFAFSMVNYFARNLDNLLIGKFFGTNYLGYYDKAYRLTTYPTGLLTNVITPVLQPILSDYKDRKDIIYDKYIKIIKILSLLGVFIVTYCYFAAEDIIAILYGDQWMDAVPYFAMLILSVWTQMIMGTTGSIYQSVGNTKLLFFCGCINTFITIIAIVVGILEDSVFALARNVAIAYNCHFLVGMPILIKCCLRQSYQKFLKIFVPECIMFIVLFSIGTLVRILVRGYSHFMMAGIWLFIIGGIYVLLCYMLKQFRYLMYIKSGK